MSIIILDALNFNINNISGHNFSIFINQEGDIQFSSHEFKAYSKVISVGMWN